MPASRSAASVLAAFTALSALSGACAALKPGAEAPRFTAPACQSGREYTFSLAQALGSGPVVVYFFPADYTSGCDLEAHAFAADKAAFAAAHAQVVGVSADGVARLKAFSKDPDYCAGAFPVVSDPEGRVAHAFGLDVFHGLGFLKDVRGERIGHGFIPRTTFVVRPDGRIATVCSSHDPSTHASEALAAVRAMAGAR